MNKFGKRLVVALMAASMLATPVYAAPNTDEIQAEKEQKEKEVQSVQAQLQTMVSKISETEEKLITKGEEIQKAKEDLAEAEKKQEQQYESMKVRIKYMYEQGDTKALEDLFTSNSIADFLNQADYIETVHNYDREKLEEYVETKEQIASLKESLEKDLEKLEKMQASFESQKEALSETLTQKQAEVANLDQELQAAIAQAAAEEEARRKAAEEAQRKAAEEAASKESASNSNTTSGQAIRRVGIRLPVILPIGRQAVEHRIRIRTILLRSQVHPSQVHLSRVQVPVRILPQVQEIPVRRAGSSARQEAVLVHRMYGQETHQV